MYGQIVQNTPELNVAARHLRMQGSFDELRSLAQKWLVPRSDAEDFISGKRYCLKEIPLEERAYTDAGEKLRAEMMALDDKFFADIIGRHLIGKCGQEDFAKKVLVKHKALQKCLDFIMEKGFQAARERAGQKGREDAGRNTAMAFRDEEVFAWAEEYYARDDAGEDAEKAEENRKKILAGWETQKAKPAPGKKTGSRARAKKEKKTDGRDTMQQTGKKAGGKKKEPAAGQMNLFDMLPGTAEK